ncbi:MAG: hypothetical protein KBD10_00785 [Candidatus Pacebacteria bacterium]|nr:hypothetical protein [Candidatus Paceibacterota bacterium]
MRDFLKSILITFLLAPFILPVLVGGQVRQSTNYQIERDSLNIGGGFGSSANYQLQNTTGEAATGYSSSTNFSNQSGFQQNLEEIYISISAPSDLSMSSINGLTGGVSTSSASWTVITNNNSGYSLSIKSSTDPSMKSLLDSFDDYTPSTADPDYDFTISNSTAAFGFSPNGLHVVDRFKDDGVDCNVGSGNTLYKCWDGLDTVEQTVFQSASSNDPSGTISTIDFQAESGNNKILTAGDYSATITMTALAL